MNYERLTEILENIAFLLKIKGENPFKSRAYSQAAITLRENEIDVAKAVKEGTLAEIKGFGKALQEKITDFAENGKMQYYEKLTREIPESVVEIVKVNRVGIKKTKQLYEELGIVNIDQLEKACDEGKISKLSGFSKKTEEQIFNSIGHIRARRGRFLQEAAREEAENLLTKIRNAENAAKAEITGAMRRNAEIIDKIEIVAQTNSIETIAQEISPDYNFIQKNNTLRGTSVNGIPIIIYASNKENFAKNLLEKTGSTEFLNNLSKINFSIKNAASETEIFEKNKMQFIPAELREKDYFIDTAKNKKLPKLIENSDLKGMLHCHSDWSDGKHSVKQMAEASQKLGFEYFAICDHSRAANYANGLSIERVKLQQKEIAKINKDENLIPVIKGIESDILSDGSLDYPEEILQSFDLIVASIHSGFTMNKSAMTKRIIKALENPYAHILGHPTGRLLLSRQPYEIDIDEIIAAAAENEKIIEINANPYRLDLPWENLIRAKEKGVKIAINPDSHKTETLPDVYLGIKMARKAGLEPADVINCLTYKEFIKEIQKI